MSFAKASPATVAAVRARTAAAVDWRNLETRVVINLTCCCHALHSGRLASANHSFAHVCNAFIRAAVLRSYDNGICILRFCLAPPGLRQFGSLDRSQGKRGFSLANLLQMTVLQHRTSAIRQQDPRTLHFFTLAKNIRNRAAVSQLRKGPTTQPQRDLRAVLPRPSLLAANKEMHAMTFQLKHGKLRMLVASSAVLLALTSTPVLSQAQRRSPPPSATEIAVQLQLSPDQEAAFVRVMEAHAAQEKCHFG